MDKAKRKLLTKALFEAVGQALAREGFVFRATAHKFIRRHGGVTDQYHLACTNERSGYYVNPTVGVRIERVEEIFHQSSGFDPKYRGDTATMGAFVGELLNGDTLGCRFLLNSESDVHLVAQDLLRIFWQIAIPYFERWGSLEAVDAELNDDPTRPTLHRSLAWFRCSTGIIVAKLVGRPDYEQLAATYGDIMTRDNDGFYLKFFKELLKSLENVEAGSGLSPPH
jgi:hypothetical protein